MHNRLGTGLNQCLCTCSNRIARSIPLQRSLFHRDLAYPVGLGRSSENIVYVIAPPQLLPAPAVHP